MVLAREQIVNKLKAQIRVAGHIIGVAVGAGSTAKHAIKGGADLLLALNSGRFRQMGQSSLAGWLPFGNCNELVSDFGTREILPIAREIPVIFGLNATDPTIKLESYVERIRALGFAGINNFPTIGMLDGQFREALEEQGLSFEREIEAVRIAHRLDLFTLAFVFDGSQAREMLKAGADLICVHLGLTKGGSTGAKKALSLQAAKCLAEEVFAVCDEVGPHVIKMIYGGPVKTPTDLSFMYQHTRAMGYIGGSSFERIPSEEVITGITRAFKQTGYPEQDELLAKMIEGVHKHYDYVDFVKEYVSVNYRSTMLFSDLARVAHVSRSHLSTLFKKEVGCTFPEYVRQFRIAKAKEFIKVPHMKLNEVAGLCGFNDYAHFSKTFKKLTGLAPEQYQRREKTGQGPESLHDKN